jgi:tryptophan synthase beta chain
MQIRTFPRIDLAFGDLPDRWYNVLPDLPRAPEPLLDARTGEKLTNEYLARLLSTGIVAQETCFDRWIPIPTPVLEAYRLWRPTPLYRATELEKYLGTPAEIYYKFEGGSPTGSHKLNSALAQAYYARLSGVKRLITDTGAGQWGSALSLAGQIFGVEVQVFMVRASYHQKPYRRYLMQTYGAQVFPSPGVHSEFGRKLLAEHPDHPGSEATAVSEALEMVYQDPEARFAMGGFGNHVLLHQTVLGLEAQEQLARVDRVPDFVIASLGCGSNMGGIGLPWVADKLNGREITLLAAEPKACPTLTQGTYRYDFADASGTGPMARTYTLGHEFVPPPIHAGGLRYHGCAPLMGLLRDEKILDAVAYHQTEIFEAGNLFARLQGLLPAPETCHAIRAAIEIANECKRSQRKAVILFCYSGHGLLDLEAYGRFQAGQLEDVETLVERLEEAREVVV